jgi:hypothetical protein
MDRDADHERAVVTANDNTDDGSALRAAAGLALLYLSRHLDALYDEYCAYAENGRPMLDTARSIEQEQIYEVRTIISDLSEALRKTGHAL